MNNISFFDDGGDDSMGSGAGTDDSGDDSSDTAE